MKKKEIIIISIIAVFVIFMGIICGIYLSNKTKNNDEKNSVATFSKEKEPSKEEITDKLNKVEKEIAGISENNLNNEVKEENYSDLYKDYLELSEEEKSKSEIIPRKEEVPFEKLEEIIEDEEIDREDEIPDKFNLADVIDIKVEDQGFYGLCWDFASLNTIETYLALNNLGNYDFSELHVDYITSDLMYGNRSIHDGGSFEIFENYLVESGLVLEEEIPYNYKIYTEEEYNNFVDMKKVVEVTETVDFPSIYKSEDSRYTEEELKEFRETVKKHIMKNGGLYTCIVANGGVNAYVAPDSSEWTNHAVTIVGWDDNYSKDNFLSIDGKKPSKDGAYIALNSWGEYSNDGGYYYISYEDKYVESNLSGISSISMDSAYKISAIKNKALKEYLEENYKNLFINYNGEDYITKIVLSNVNTLDLSNINLTSLDGIEMFPNVFNLNLANNKIKDITPLMQLTNLSYLDLSNNQITDISAFSDIKTKMLYSINLSQNKIKDVSAINNITSDNEWYSIELNISNNPGVTGYEKLNNISALNISDCNIEIVDNLQECTKLVSLNASNNPGIKGLEEISENVYTIKLSNCNLDVVPKLNDTIICLDISKNNITTLDGIQDYKNLYTLDVSKNPITDWSALKELTKENIDINSEEYEYIDEWGETILNAEDCNIEDITIFNDIQIPGLVLYLKDNKIKDVSQLNNKNIYYIDLSNNENLTGLQGLSKINNVFLNNCNIEDTNEILKLEKVRILSLENNNLKDITELSNLKKLESLSVAGNKELKGTLSFDELYNLNISDCNLDNTFDLSKIPHLSYLNMSKNPNLTKISDVVEKLESGYISIIFDNCSFEEIEKIKTDSKDKYVYIENATINLNYNLPEGESKIDLKQNRLLKNELRKNFINGQIKVENGTLQKNGSIIDIKDVSKEYVEISFNGWGSIFDNSKIKIIFKPEEEENNSVNEINNVIKDTNTSEVENATNKSN